MHGPTQEEILRVADSGMYLAKHQEGNRVRVASVTLETAQADWERQLLEAYLGVTMKRMFSTGPEAFNHYLERFQHVTRGEQRGSTLAARYRNGAGLRHRRQGPLHAGPFAGRFTPCSPDRAAAQPDRRGD